MSLRTQPDQITCIWMFWGEFQNTVGPHSQEHIVTLMSSLQRFPQFQGHSVDYSATPGHWMSVIVVSWCSELWTIYTAYVLIVQYNILYAIEMCLLISCLVLTQLILTMKPVWWPVLYHWPVLHGLGLHTAFLWSILQPGYKMADSIKSIQISMNNLHAMHTVSSVA